MTQNREVVGSNHGTIFWLVCCKGCIDVCLKRPKINEKEAGVGPFLKNNCYYILRYKNNDLPIHYFNGEPF